MTPEELKAKLESDLKIVEQFLDVAKRNNVAVTLEMPNGTHRNGTHRTADGDTDDGGTPYGIIGPAVVAAIEQCPKRFDVRDIIKRLVKSGKADISTAQIATALRRFEKQGKLKKVSQGAGRRPTKYATTSQ